MTHLDEAIAGARYNYDCLCALKKILDLPTCNECGSRKDCQYAPEWGQSVRYNCPHFTAINGKEYEVR